MALLASILGASGCSSLLYAPTRVWHVNPERLGYAYDTVSFDSSDGSRTVRIHGWWFRQTRLNPPKGFLIFFHGNGENRSSHFLSLGWILDQGYDYFIFDYQGYGDSEGSPSPAHTVRDGTEALRWFFKTGGLPRYRESPLFVFAQSLGGPVALRSLQEIQNTEALPPSLAGVILDSSFLSYTDAGASVLSRQWFTYLFQPLSYLLLSDEWAPVTTPGSLPRLKYLVLHGEQDQTIDLKLGKRLFDTLPEPKTWIPVPGARHIHTLFTDDRAQRERMLQFLQARHPVR